MHLDAVTNCRVPPPTPPPPRQAGQAPRLPCRLTSIVNPPLPNNLLWTLPCQEDAQLLLTVVAHNDDNDVHGAPVPLRLVVVAGWLVLPKTRAALPNARTHTTPATTFSNIIIIIAVLSCSPYHPGFQREKALALPSSFDLSLSQTFLYSVHVTTR